MFTFLVLLAIAVILYVSVTRRYRAPDLSQFDSPQDPLIKQSSEISPQHDDVVQKLKEFSTQSGIKIDDQRRRMEDLFFQEVDAEIAPVDVSGISSEWVTAEGADPDKRLLYVHGGAFRVGSPKTHRFITAALSRLAGVSVLAIDYRMQPEFKTMDCHLDTQTAYRWIIENGPNGPSPASELYVSGDSAGGNLTLSVINWARDQNLRAANGAIALAPLTDATMSSPTWISNKDSDPFLGPSIGQMLKLPTSLVHLLGKISGGAAPNHPILSPVLADLSNLPPILIQASADEMLYGDAQRYANKARQAGSEVTLQLWPKLVHVFQGFGPDLPEANEAFELIGEFIRAQGTKTKPEAESSRA